MALLKPKPLGLAGLVASLCLILSLCLLSIFACIPCNYVKTNIRCSFLNFNHAISRLKVHNLKAKWNMHAMCNFT